jgi:hypothetical protein
VGGGGGAGDVRERARGCRGDVVVAPPRSFGRRHYEHHLHVRHAHEELAVLPLRLDVAEHVPHGERDDPGLAAAGAALAAHRVRLARRRLPVGKHRAVEPPDDLADQALHGGRVQLGGGDGRAEDGVEGVARARAGARRRRREQRRGRRRIAAAVARAVARRVALRERVVLDAPARPALLLLGPAERAHAHEYTVVCCGLKRRADGGRCVRRRRREEEKARAPSRARARATAATARPRAGAGVGGEAARARVASWPSRRSGRLGCRPPVLSTRRFSPAARTHEMFSMARTATNDSSARAPREPVRDPANRSRGGGIDKVASCCRVAQSKSDWSPSCARTFARPSAEAEEGEPPSSCCFSSSSTLKLAPPPHSTPSSRLNAYFTTNLASAITVASSSTLLVRPAVSRARHRPRLRALAADPSPSARARARA